MRRRRITAGAALVATDIGGIFGSAYAGSHPAATVAAILAWRATPAAGR